MFKKLRRQSNTKTDKEQQLFKTLARIEKKLDGKVFADDVFIENIKSEDVLPLLKRDKQSVRIAKKALKNEKECAIMTTIMD